MEEEIKLVPHYPALRKEKDTNEHYITQILYHKVPKFAERLLTEYPPVLLPISKWLDEKSYK